MVKDVDSIPRVGKIPWRKAGQPIQYFCLENLMDRGAWWATVHRVAKSQTQVKWLSTQAPIGIKFFSHSDQQAWAWSRKPFMTDSYLCLLSYLLITLLCSIWPFSCLSTSSPTPSLNFYTGCFLCLICSFPDSPSSQLLLNCHVILTKLSLMGLQHFLPISFLANLVNFFLLV